MIGDTRNTAVYIRTAELFGGDGLSRRGLNQGRPAKKDRALVLDNDRFIAHRRYIRAASGARSQDRRDLVNSFGRHGGLIVEDATEVLAIRKDFGLQGKERATGIH